MRFHAAIFDLRGARRSACATILIAIFAASLPAASIDSVLTQLIPPDSVSLFGAHMDQLKATPLYQKLVAQKKLPQLDQFATETGFDPRRDVRELLAASNGKETVLLARGTFHLGNIQGVTKSSYKGYTIYARGEGGYCLLDSTLAVAGQLPELHAALDQYKSGNRSATAALLAKAQSIPGQNQVWAVSVGGADFIARNLPQDGNGANFARIFRALQNTVFHADMRNGLDLVAQGNCQTEKDAKDLGDAARGLIGFGRLSVPENQPELLRLWDGIHVDQNQKNINITAKISQDLIDKLVQMVSGSAWKPRPR